MKRLTSTYPGQNRDLTSARLGDNLNYSPFDTHHLFFYAQSSGREKIMDVFDDIDQIIDFAIEKEEESCGFYLDLAGKMERPEMQEVFRDFADEERGHKKKLEAVKRGDYSFGEPKEPVDLEAANYIVAEKTAPDMSYQDALIVAMKREKVSFKLYSDLARLTFNPDVEKLFLQLAQQEARHKLLFELEYDAFFINEE